MRSERRRLAATLHLPKGAGSRRLPAVLFCHGFTGNRIETRRLFVRLAWQLEAKGIASLRFDYSGCGESAGEFAAFSVQDYISDAHAALRFLTSRKVVEPARVVLLGYSLGACVAAYVAADAATRPRSVVLWAPVAEPHKTFMQNREDLSAYLKAAETLPYVEYHGWRIGKHFIQGLKELSPADMLVRAGVPVLLCHGLADEVVPAQASRSLAQRLRHADIPVETLFLEGAEHSFSSHAIDERLFAKTVDWFVKTLA